MNRVCLLVIIIINDLCNILKYFTNVVLCNGTGFEESQVSCGM